MLRRGLARAACAKLAACRGTTPLRRRCRSSVSAKLGIRSRSPTLTDVNGAALRRESRIPARKSCRYALRWRQLDALSRQAIAGATSSRPGERPERARCACSRARSGARHGGRRRPDLEELRRARCREVECRAESIAAGVGAAARHRDEEVEHTRRAVARPVNEHEAAAARAGQRRLRRSTMRSRPPRRRRRRCRLPRGRGRRPLR